MNLVKIQRYPKSNSSVLLLKFQMLKNHVWPVTTPSDSTDVEDFHHHRTFYWTLLESEYWSTETVGRTEELPWWHLCTRDKLTLWRKEDIPGKLRRYEKTKPQNQGRKEKAGAQMHRGHLTSSVLSWEKLKVTGCLPDAMYQIGASHLFLFPQISIKTDRPWKHIPNQIKTYQGKKTTDQHPW